MSDYRDGYVQAICEIGAIAYERAAEGPIAEKDWHMRPRNTRRSHFGMRWPSPPKCSTTTAKERRDKEDTE